MATRPLTACVVVVGLIAAAVALVGARGVAHADSLCGDGTTTSAGGAVTCTFSYTGAEQTFTVPLSVSSLRVLAHGAPGGYACCVNEVSAAGGEGATVTGDLSVTAAQTLYVEVGGPGTTTNCFAGAACIGGFNGGGSSLTGGGGGGASDIRTVSSASGDVSLASRLLVAAGGGGGGEEGATDGACVTATGFLFGGAGGNGGNDGAAGEGCNGVAGGAGGVAGAAGSAAGEDGGANDGGGGGGGLSGGGAGGEGGGFYPNTGSGGGGGGSNLVPSGGSAGVDPTGTPEVIISYTIPALVAQTTALLAQVNSLNLGKQQASYDTQLQAVLGDLNTNNGLACGDLTAFINHVTAQSGKQLTTSQANQLIAAAQQIQAVAGC